MSNNNDFHGEPPHVALFPSAGMGHLTPFLRLADMLASRGCIVTVVTAMPTVSTAESAHISSFFSNYPHINRLEFEIPESNLTNTTTADPFFIRWNEINRSAHLLKPLLLSSSPPLSAIFSDIAIVNSINPIADDLSLPNYVVFTTCARFLSLFASLPFLFTSDTFNNSDVQIPGLLVPIPLSSIPPPFFDSNHLFTSIAISNALSLPKTKGILLNTFEEFESDTISALKDGRVLSCPIPVQPVGPLEPYKFELGHRLSWYAYSILIILFPYLVSFRLSIYIKLLNSIICFFLFIFNRLDDQIVGSVVYVSFGSRTAMSEDQIRELGNGLERSGCSFLWVLKTSKVDKEDKQELEELLGDSFLERTKKRGIVVKGWVNQEEILRNPAIGGFISHCGWNSVMESARFGVPILAWPLHGDQRVNAEVVENAGLGMWVRDWGWGGERLVKGEEIGDKVRELMSDEKLRNKAREIGEQARKAFEANGSSEKALMGLVDMLKHTNKM